MKHALLIFCFLFSLSAAARDITNNFYKIYNSPGRFSQKDLSYLGKNQLVFVPGILSEVFSGEDERGNVDFSVISSDYFEAQVKHFKNVLRLPTKKILSSSKNVAETKALIRETINASRDQGKRIVFVTHSLGGLALMDYLLETSPAEWEPVIDGVAFLQSPFYGSPIATVFLDNPYHADKWLRPFLPWVNVSMETIIYLSVAYRTKFMLENEARIREVLSRVNALTLSGITNGHRSVFKPAADVMKTGCLLNALGRCLSAKLYPGPYDLSDGMVPLNSSRLAGLDSVVLEGVDHGEPIVKLPFQEFSKEVMTEAMIKLLLDH